MPDEPSRLDESLILLSRAQAGDGEALNRLIGRYYGRVLRIIRLRMGPALRQRVESGDILQQTFAAAVTSLDGFEARDEASLIHWLSRIAENRIRSEAEFHGAQKRDPKREVPLADTPSGAARGEGAPEPVAGARAVSDELSDGEWIAILEGCIHALPEQQRDAILLRNYAEASWQAVADEVGLDTPDAARKCHGRAMKALMKMAMARVDE